MARLFYLCRSCYPSLLRTISCNINIPNVQDRSNDPEKVELFICCKSDYIESILKRCESQISQMFIEHANLECFPFFGIVNTIHMPPGLVKVYIVLDVTIEQ